MGAQPACHGPGAANAYGRGGGNQTGVSKEGFNVGGTYSCSKESYRCPSKSVPGYDVTPSAPCGDGDTSKFAFNGAYSGPQFEPVGGYPGKYAKEGIYTYGFGGSRPVILSPPPPHTHPFFPFPNPYVPWRVRCLQATTRGRTRAASTSSSSSIRSRSRRTSRRCDDTAPQPPEPSRVFVSPWVAELECCCAGRLRAEPQIRLRADPSGYFPPHTPLLPLFLLLPPGVLVAPLLLGLVWPSDLDQPTDRCYALSSNSLEHLRLHPDPAGRLPGPGRYEDPGRTD